MNFKNLTIKYDKEIITPKLIKKINRINNIGCSIVLMTSVFLVICSIALLLKVYEFGILFLLGELSILLFIMIADVSVIVAITCTISSKAEPPHYELIAYLLELNKDDIEVGWLNNRYIINVNTVKDGWVKRELDEFLEEPYVLEDNAIKEYPINMIIDMTKENVRVVTIN